MSIQPGEQLKARGITVWIEDDAVMLKYSVMYYGFLGTKRVPVSNITAVNWKDPGSWTVGFLELAILGEKPVPSHASPNVQNQNRISFETADLPKFAALRDWVQQRIGKPKTISSTADELSKLADLLKEGFITREEFDVQKAKLLG
ncbi:MAG: SHOCT domain-containing protein [Proteobacteria bacterium]|nr:SHOCT domain-containing protein [Pseudomonadota bacterium]